MSCYLVWTSFGLEFTALALISVISFPSQPGNVDTIRESNLDRPGDLANGRSITLLGSSLSVFAIIAIAIRSDRW